MHRHPGNSRTRSNPPLPSAIQPTDPSVRLAAEYSAKADAYDALWAPVINPAAHRLFDALDLASARRVLDLGCGTGSLFEALRSRAPGARLVGADRALGMLTTARLRSGNQPLNQVDARALPFCDDAFDVATLVFMLFHVPDPARALREVRRVLRPGGSVGVLVWAGSASTADAPVWTEELDARGAADDPRDPRVTCHERMNEPSKLRSLLEDAGFGNPRLWENRLNHRWQVPDLVAMQVSCGPAHRRLASLTPTDRLDCIRTVQKRLDDLPCDHLVLRSKLLYATATA